MSDIIKAKEHLLESLGSFMSTEDKKELQEAINLDKDECLEEKEETRKVWAYVTEPI
ncbi:MAG TPA: hypothetical protein VF941_11890 [Clostridia bacterium]